MASLASRTKQKHHRLQPPGGTPKVPPSGFFGGLPAARPSEGSQPQALRRHYSERQRQRLDAGSVHSFEGRTSGGGRETLRAARAGSASHTTGTSPTAMLRRRHARQPWVPRIKKVRQNPRGSCEASLRQTLYNEQWAFGRSACPPKEADRLGIRCYPAVSLGRSLLLASLHWIRDRPRVCLSVRPNRASSRALQTLRTDCILALGLRTFNGKIASIFETSSSSSKPFFSRSSDEGDLIPLAEAQPRFGVDVPSSPSRIRALHGHQMEPAHGAEIPRDIERSALRPHTLGCGDQSTSIPFSLRSSKSAKKPGLSRWAILHSSMATVRISSSA